jgi:hypothetical protein
MQLSKTQIAALLTEVASQEDGFNEILRMSFEAMMSGFLSYRSSRIWNMAFYTSTNAPRVV